MGTQDPLVRIEAATLTGGNNNQDRYAYGNGWAFVLDGASSFSEAPPVHDGGWYAERLSIALTRRLPDTCRSTVRLIAEAIEEASSGHDANTQGACPTSTISLARWSESTLEIFVLGDSTAIWINKTGTHHLTDQRLASIARDLRFAYKSRLAAGAGFDAEHQRLLSRLQKEQEIVRNTPAGYWIAGDDPSAASQGIHICTDLHRPSTLILATDGIPQEDLMKYTTDRPRDIIASRTGYENSDPEGRKSPRSKKHDDKTVIRVSITQTPQIGTRTTPLKKKQLKCPFCGRIGPGSAEHVYGKWLRRTAGAQELLANDHGETMPRTHLVVEQNPSGRFVAHDIPAGSWAVNLPHVKVDVCSQCNNGWMSALEGAAKNIIGPFIFDHETLHLSPSDLETIATWATKTWMAYALNYDQLTNPFTTEEYRRMADTPKPLARSFIWMMAAHDPRAQVSLLLHPTLWLRRTPDMAHDQNNAAFGYLATGCLCLYMMLVPEDAPQELINELTSIVMPSTLLSFKVRQSWPNPRKSFFPIEPLSSTDLSTLLTLRTRIESAASLPGIGLTPEEIKTVHTQFLAGTPIEELRETWGSGERTEPLKGHGHL